ncbi:hypothetical protein [Enterocloster lavalensis]|uniref:hypothetical protein n=1 Tax=Enterocloster lavalensis TaxID=460384 RepID=UPI0020464BBA|nr:MAG TPA: hypothetical protein [Caudoviricetes sp.]
MRRIRTCLLLTLLLTLVIPFTAYGEGMSKVGGGKKEAIWMYVTDEEDEHGIPICLTNQWKQVWDYWYYFGENGKSIQSAWKEIDGKWYYFDEYSIMLHDTTTPDGYYVGSDGAWDQNEPVAVQ